MVNKIVATGLFFVLCCLAAAGADVINVKGSVTTPNGTPLKGVGVSDGVKIVQTDAQGHYAFHSDKQQKLVFVITPSGYTAPVKADGMLADFWQKLTLSPNETETVNFTLTPQDQSQYNVLFTTDIHLDRHPRQQDLMHFHKQAMPNIKRLANDLAKTGKPYFVFHLGDVSTDAHWYEFKFPIDSAYSRLLDEKFPGPLYNIPGNHDNDPRVIGKNVDFRSEWRYRKVFGPTYYSMNIGKDHWIMMDNIIYINTRGGKNIRIIEDPAKDTIPRVRGKRNYDVGLTDTQMEWLRQDLAMMPKGQIPRFCTHASLLFEYPQGKGTQFTDNAQLDTLIAWLAKYDGKLHAYSGHTHRMQYAHNDYFPQVEDFMLPAVSGNVWGNGSQHMLGIDGSDAGCVTAYFNGDKVTYDYTTHMYGKKYMRLYDMNSVMKYYQQDSLTQARLATNKMRTDYSQSDFVNMVYANIWDVRPDDVVRMYEGGRELKTTKVLQSDPIIMASPAVTNNLFVGPQYPICYHLFAAKANTATQRVTVKVLDKNGHLRHQETITRPKAFSPEME